VVVVTDSAAFPQTRLSATLPIYLWHWEEKYCWPEFPELCGIEQELVDRSTSEPVASKFIHLMKAYEETVIKAGSDFSMNPSPGNIKGWIDH
jgi:altronate dehydratase